MPDGPLRRMISPEAQILPDERSRWRWVRPGGVVRGALGGGLAGLLGSAGNPLIGALGALQGGGLAVQEGMYGPTNQEELLETGVGPKGNLPPLKFPYLFHGTSSRSARGIRAKGLQPQRGKVYLTTSPEIAMAEAVSSATGIHPMLSGAIKEENLTGMPLQEIYARTMRYAKRHPDKPGVAKPDKPARGGKPIILKVRRSDVKGLERDPEYMAQYVDDEWSDWVGDPASRARSFFLKKPVPPSSIEGAVNTRQPVSPYYDPREIPPLLRGLIQE